MRRKDHEAVDYILNRLMENAHSYQSVGIENDTSQA